MVWVKNKYEVWFGQKIKYEVWYDPKTLITMLSLKYGGQNLSMEYDREAPSIVLGLIGDIFYRSLFMC